MCEVHLAGSLRDAVGGAATVDIDANTVAALLRKLVERYPLMREKIDEGIAVSIGGEIYRDNWSKTIPQGVEVYLLPRIPGG
ncbi:MAG: MoaD/ThiS family protein [Gammaproteobacteria bacterium]|nr:MoaD/ThiS family protein [Gammaproteobacteria bacterium]